MTRKLGPGDEGARPTVDLRPGAYELYCDIPGHYPAGQHTTFTVTADDRDA